MTEKPENITKINSENSEQNLGTKENLTNNETKKLEKIVSQNKNSKFGVQKILAVLTTGLLVLFFFAFLTLFWLTPSNFRSPLMDHSHFRLQYIFQGQVEDFGSPRYQVDYIKDVCNDALTESPIHFHDNKGQIVHIHWQKVTGGQVLKFYGLNKIGGLDNIMGWKLNDLTKFKLTQIPIHSQSLPQPKGNDKFWVYVGDKGKFEKREFEDFVKMDLETFFGQNSIIRQNQEEEETLQKKISQNINEKLTKNLETLIKLGGIEVQSHSGTDHSNETEEEAHLAETMRLKAEKQAVEDRNNLVFSSNSNSIFSSNSANSSQNISNINSQDSINSNSTDSNQNLTQNSAPNSTPDSAQNSPVKTETELKKINNLLGNVVIFVQENEPTQSQIQLRFDNLEPLLDSVCGG